MATDPGAEKGTPAYVEGNPDDGAVVVGADSPLVTLQHGDMLLVGRSCWVRISGGVGGQAMTPCSVCGVVMASTAGPHPSGEMVLTPCRVIAVEQVKDDRYVIAYRRLLVRDGEVR